MASFIDRLFRRQGKAPAVEPVESAPPPYSIPVIQAPPDYPPALLRRVPQRQRRPAHRQRKRRTAEEIEADRKAFAEGSRAQAAIRHAYEAKRAAEAGITHYRWLTARDTSACPTCQERDGKVFAFHQPAGFKHPGMVECADGDACRCTFAPMVEGFA